MSNSIKPLYDRVVVERLDAEDVSAGGILLPDSAKEKPAEGSVLAVGAGKYDNGSTRPLTVKVGDKVLFGKYAGTEVKLSDKPVVIMSEDDILAIVD